MSSIVPSPVNPITITKVKKGQKISRSLTPSQFCVKVAPEDGVLIREDIGQKLRGSSIYIRNSDLKKMKSLKFGQEAVVFPWEDNGQD